MTNPVVLGRTFHGPGRRWERGAREYFAPHAGGPERRLGFPGHRRESWMRRAPGHVMVLGDRRCDGAHGSATIAGSSRRRPGLDPRLCRSKPYARGARIGQLLVLGYREPRPARGRRRLDDRPRPADLVGLPAYSAGLTATSAIADICRACLRKVWRMFRTRARAAGLRSRFAAMRARPRTPSSWSMRLGSSKAIGARRLVWISKPASCNISRHSRWVSGRAPTRILACKSAAISALVASESASGVSAIS